MFPVLLHIGDGWDVEVWTSETADGALVAGTTDLLSILVLDVALEIGVWTTGAGAEEPMGDVSVSTLTETFSSFSFIIWISVSMLLYVLLHVCLKFSRWLHFIVLLSHFAFSCN